MLACWECTRLTRKPASDADMSACLRLCRPLGCRGGSCQCPCERHPGHGAQPANNEGQAGGNGGAAHGTARHPPQRAHAAGRLAAAAAAAADVQPRARPAPLAAAGRRAARARPAGCTSLSPPGPQRSRAIQRPGPPAGEAGPAGIPHAAAAPGTPQRLSAAAAEDRAAATQGWPCSLCGRL